MLGPDGHPWYVCCVSSRPLWPIAAAALALTVLPTASAVAQQPAGRTARGRRGRRDAPGDAIERVHRAHPGDRTA